MKTVAHSRTSTGAFVTGSAMTLRGINATETGGAAAEFSVHEGTDASGRTLFTGKLLADETTSTPLPDVLASGGVFLDVTSGAVEVVAYIG